MHLPHALTTSDNPAIGLVVLQADQRIESDLWRLLPEAARLHVTRVPSGRDVTPETLRRMETDIPGAVRLLPPATRFHAIGYACTSGAAEIGPSRVADLVHSAARTRAVTDPLSALLAACRSLGIARLAVISPYIASVSRRLLAALADGGVTPAAFGSFDIAEEARVARISPDSVIDAARQVALGGLAEGVFLSCTNLDTLDCIDPLERDLGLPVLSSNQVLAWHLCALAGLTPSDSAPGAVFRAHLAR